MSLFYAIKVPLFEWKEQRWVAKQFYADPAFRKLDQALISGPNPFHQARIFPYGETPLRALYAMGKAAQLKETDCFIDLGCGRGRGVFFLSHFFGCEAIGVDLTSSFIVKARRLALEHGVKKVTFQYQDFFKFKFPKDRMVWVYLYGTNYSEECLKILEERLMAQLPSGSCVVTVSSALRRIDAERKMEVLFPWGKGVLFFHRLSGGARQG